MKLVLQLSVAILEALQGTTFSLNISPFLETHNTPTHRMDGRGTEREREIEIEIERSKSTTMQIKAVWSWQKTGYDRFLGLGWSKTLDTKLLGYYG